MKTTHLDDNGDFLSPGLVIEREGETHDMTIILRDLGAEPLSPQLWSVNDLMIDKGALMRGEDRLVTPFGIRAAARAQLGILRDTYPPIETEEEYRRGDRIDFYDLYTMGEWECMLRPEGQTIFRTNDQILVAKLHCEDADLIGIWSFHVIVKEQKS